MSSERRIEKLEATDDELVKALGEKFEGAIVEAKVFAGEMAVEVERDRWLEVRFDRLLHDPATEAARIGRFCGVESPEALADIAEAFMDPGFVFEKRVEPTPSEWCLINDMIGPFSQSLGYAD